MAPRHKTSARKLSAYRAKRNFSRTQEPRGLVGKSSRNRLRFVVHKHAARRLHFDLRLEFDGVFKSWAVTKGPSLDPSVKRLAVEVEDHPLDYGDFEGTIPKGEYGGGTVMLWDRGYWWPENNKFPDQALSDGELKFVLDGQRLTGGFVLVRLKHDRTGGKRTNWLLIKHRDGVGQSVDPATGDDDISVASGRRMQDIAAGRGKGPVPFMADSAKRASPAAVWSSSKARAAAVAPAVPARPPGKRAAMPRFVLPQLCRTLAVPPDGPSWVHEIKFDGYRLQARIEHGKVKLFTRSGLDWTDRFKPIVAAATAARLPDSLLDGEIVASDERGHPSFAALQAALDQGEQMPLVYYVFDLLFERGHNLRQEPLAVRKARLAALLSGAGDRIIYVDHIVAPGAEIIRRACELQLEGIVSKRLDAPYRSARTHAWCKVKCRPGQEVVIGGFSRNANSLRSLLVGVHRQGHLAYVGRVGTGFTSAIAADLMEKLRGRLQNENPFSGKGAPRKAADVSWVRPDLVAEIEFAGWTGDGNVRQASFKGLRGDKPARNIVREPATGPRRTDSSARTGASARKPRIVGGAATVMGVAISNPDKELWPANGTLPAVTKLDLAKYLEDAAPYIMPYVEGIPCSIIRAPDGIEGPQRFFQRHSAAGMSELVSEVTVEGDRKPYIQLDRPEALAAVAQMGGVELHPWNCAPYRPQLPGRLVFDLDPAPDVAFRMVVAAAKEMRQRLEHIGLGAFCKTTGGKGLHVVVPLDVRGGDELGWPMAKAFAQQVCADMAADSPDRYLIKMTKALRSGRIFLDYLRNDRMATAVALLSPRARPGAPVSMPLAWSQVRADLDPQRFTLRTAMALMCRSKPWADYATAARSLARVLRKSGDARARKPAISARKGR